MKDMKLEIVILAAGQGTRMRSTLPKVLHPLAGRPLLAHVLDTAASLSPQQTHVVVGHGADKVVEQIGPRDGLKWVEQREQLGTGHAVDQAMAAIDDAATVLVLYGDVPLVRGETLQALLAAAQQGIGLLTVELAEPKGYGRILRDASHNITAIVEEKDANDAQRKIREGNTGILCAPAALLRQWLTRLENGNAQGEYYLTDIIAMAVQDDVPVHGVQASDPDEVSGVNNRRQLAQMERAYQLRQAEQLMDQGATLIDPARFDLRGRLTIGEDVLIDANVIIEGTVVLGNRVRIGPHVVLRDSVVGDDVCIEAMSHIQGATLGAQCQLGPYARLRPGSELAEQVKVGNFVEIKKSQLGQGSKVNHLSYIGDTQMGANVNIGAGTITCNYDGANKHQTVIGDNVFIGSDTQLVAPVEVGEGATIGAGSTITSNAPGKALTLSRSKQRSLENWKRPEKKSS